MKGKEKLMGLLGSAVILGLGAEGASTVHAAEGKCGNMNKGAEQKTEKGKKEEKKKKEKKKTKEMACGGQGACGGQMKQKDGNKS